MTPDPRILILASGEGNATELDRLFQKLPGGQLLDVRTGHPEALLTDMATLTATVLLVLDLDMAPGYRPLDLLYRMRAIPAARRLPVLAVTTAKNDLFRNMAYALGVEEYFALPADGQLVLAAAERLIRDDGLAGPASAPAASSPMGSSPVSARRRRGWRKRTKRSSSWSGSGTRSSSSRGRSSWRRVPMRSGALRKKSPPSRKKANCRWPSASTSRRTCSTS